MIYLILFYEFFKIGLFTFGGGNAMIPLIRDVVLERGWISENSFYNFIGICESTPGPIAVNMATYIGATEAGFLGGVIATLGVILPAFLVILIIAAFLGKLTSNKYYKGCLEGVKPVVAALISVSGILILLKVLIGENTLQPILDIRGLICFGLTVGTFFLYKGLIKKNMNTFLLVAMSCVFGLLLGIIFE